MSRQSDYKPEFCDMLIDHMSEGKKFTSFAGKCYVTRQTLDNWKKAHPEFEEAYQLGKGLSEVFWEEQGITGLWNHQEFNDRGMKTKETKLNTTNWIFQMKNRFDWTDKSKVESDSNVTVELSYNLDDDNEGA